MKINKKEQISLMIELHSALHFLTQHAGACLMRGKFTYELQDAVNNAEKVLKKYPVGTTLNLSPLPEQQLSITNYKEKL